MQRFVLLRHECPPSYAKPSHWDLMLEQGDSLATWELQELPSSWADRLGIQQSADKETIQAIRLSDHRLAYLEYEGSVSGNRGEVRQCDVGTFEMISLQEGDLTVRLSGAFLKSVAKLSSEGSEWILSVKHIQ